MHFGYRRESSNTHTHTPYLPFSSFFPSSSTCTAVYYHCILLVTVRLCLLPSKHSLIEHTHTYTREGEDHALASKLGCCCSSFVFFCCCCCHHGSAPTWKAQTRTHRQLPVPSCRSSSDIVRVSFSLVLFFLCVCIIIPYKSRKRKKKWRLHRFQWSVRSTT